MKHRKLFLAALLLLLSLPSSAQKAACPPNLDWELGDFSQWKFYQVKYIADIHWPPYDTVPVVPPTPATIGQIRLTSGSDKEVCGNFPKVSPYGGHYSFNLGETFGGVGLGNIAAYTIHIPPDDTDFALTYHYALVIKDPEHYYAFLQPAFSIVTRDAATGALLPCGQRNYVAGALPGFKVALCPNYGDVFYKPWTTEILPLGAYAGRSVTISFIQMNCFATYDYCCVYFDLECSTYAIKVNREKCDSVIHLSGPPGFKKYSWRDSSLARIIDTQQNITLYAPYSIDQIRLVLDPYEDNGCTDTLSASLSVFSVGLRDTSVCSGTPLALHPDVAGGIAPLSYSWGPASGLSCTTCPYPSLTANTDVVYALRVTDSAGCSLSDTMAIEVRPLPDVHASDTAVCYGDGVQLHASGAAKYQWKPASGLSCTTCSDPFFSAAGTTDFIITGTGSNGCPKEDTLSIVVHHPMKVAVQPPAPVCKGAQAVLRANGSVAYRWSPAASLSCSDCDTAIAWPSETTTYTVVGTDLNRCKDSVQVTVRVKPLPDIIVNRDSAVCLGSQVQLFASGAAQYHWSPAADLSCTDCAAPVFTVRKHTTFSVSGTGLNGCLDSGRTSMSIITDTLPSAAFTLTPALAYIDDAVFFGKNLSTNSVRYQWYFRDELLSEENDLAKRIPEYGRHCITLVAQHRCGQTDTAVRCCTVKVKGRIDIPNAFTPNGDGRNDYFRTMVLDAYRSFSLRIFNRYGEEVFAADRPEQYWDGVYDSKPQDMGVYFYLVKITFDYPGAAEELYKGDITLIR
ncbi:MAG: gliding motility-associated C-terminal domain-containing protein [Chitinophagaceae bacterium]|nr:gliding motility-associated C-terminal domain-containing protein [Chitinophagaceae bacterium]